MVPAPYYDVALTARQDKLEGCCCRLIASLLSIAHIGTGGKGVRRGSSCKACTARGGGAAKTVGARRTLLLLVLVVLLCCCHNCFQLLPLRGVHLEHVGLLLNAAHQAAGGVEVCSPGGVLIANATD